MLKITLLMFGIFLLFGCTSSGNGDGGLVIPGGNLIFEGDRTFSLTAFDDAFDPQLMEVKLGSKVTINISSRDKEYSFKLPAFQIFEILPRGTTKTVSFLADKTGEHQFNSTLSKKEREQMTGFIIVKK